MKIESFLQSGTHCHLQQEATNFKTFETFIYTLSKDSMRNCLFLFPTKSTYGYGLTADGGNVSGCQCGSNH